MRDRGDAVISADGLYRYRLRRFLDGVQDPRRVVVFCMLNPSTADAQQDDATIRKCCGFAGRWGFAAVSVVNLFAWRATKPRALMLAADPIGPDNDSWIRSETEDPAVQVVVAWGQHGRGYARRVADVCRVIGRDLRCIAVTKDGQPGHPLMLPYGSVLRPWSEL